MSLDVRELSKSFGGKIAVDQISFAIDEPGVFGLIGTNGAGKTTTIRMILGIMSSDHGTAEWNRKPIRRETLNFGYMPEERGLYMKNKVIDQLVYFGMLRGMEKSAAKQNALKLMKRLGISEYSDMQAEKLSKGNQQKVQLAATLIHDPELIFLDEPFSGLDPVNAEVLRELILELVAEKKFIVLSSHQMTTVEEFCRDILILHHGKTILKGNLSVIKSGFGRTNLVIRPQEKDRTAVEQILEASGLTLIEKRAYEYEYGIRGEADAVAVLKAMIEQEIYPLKYEVKEPSLQEIFVRSVEASERGNVK